MNQIDYPSSSDDEDQGPKKVVKIIVKEIKNVEYQRTFNPTKKGSLFALLPEPSAKKKTPLGQGGGTQVQIDIQKPIKRKIVEPIEDKIETEESDGDDIDFFTLPNTVEEISPKGKLGKKVLGPARPPQEKVIINNINTPKVQERETYILQGYDNSARGPIYVKTITQSSQMGDSYKKQKIENVSKDIPQVYDDAFKDIEMDANGGYVRNNNIMALAQQAKKKFQAFEENRADRKNVQKVVRAKYGF